MTGQGPGGERKAVEGNWKQCGYQQDAAVSLLSARESVQCVPCGQQQEAASPFLLSTRICTVCAHDALLDSRANARPKTNARVKITSCPATRKHHAKDASHQHWEPGMA